MSNTFFLVEAPYPALASAIILPNPRIGNSLGLQSSVQVIRMEDGSRRSFVKRVGGKKRHQWTFIFSRDKMEEFQDFVRRYRANKTRVTWRGEVFVGYLALNPVEFVGEGSAPDWPGGEAYQTTLELIEA